MKSVQKCLAIASAFCLSLSPLGQAQAQKAQKPRAPANTATEVEQERLRFNDQLMKNQFEGLKVYDAKGAPTTFERAMSDPKSFTDGIVAEINGKWIRIRGELLDGGKNGMLLMATLERDGRAVNGQVVTIKPGMTKLEIESRLRDLALSFNFDHASKAKRGDRQPAQDAYLVDCVVIMVLGAVVSSGLLYASGTAAVGRAAVVVGIWGLVLGVSLGIMAGINCANVGRGR